MQHKLKLTACLAAALTTTACSTKPRQFSAGVRPIRIGQIQTRDEADAYTTCNQLVRNGQRSGFAAAAASGAATGLGLFGGAAAVAASGTIGMTTTTAGVALSAAIPFVGFAAGFGVNRMIRAGKERKYKRVMSDCMAEFGYAVTDWTKVPKKQPGTAIRRDAVANPAITPAVVPVEPIAPAPDVASAG